MKRLPMIIMSAVICILGVLGTIASCANDRPPAMGPPAPPLNQVQPDDPLAHAPAPKTAEQGVDLQKDLDAARAQLKEKSEWAAAQIGVYKDKASTADKSVGVIRLASLAAFAMAAVAWFIGGWRPAAALVLVGCALAFAPTIISELWNGIRPYAIVCVVIGMGLALLYAGLWIVKHQLLRQSDKLAADGDHNASAALKIAALPRQFKSSDQRKALLETIKAATTPQAVNP